MNRSSTSTLLWNPSSMDAKHRGTYGYRICVDDHECVATWYPKGNFRDGILVTEWNTGHERNYVAKTLDKAIEVATCIDRLCVPISVYDDRGTYLYEYTVFPGSVWNHVSVFVSTHDNRRSVYASRSYDVIHSWDRERIESYIKHAQRSKS